MRIPEHIKKKILKARKLLAEFEKVNDEIIQWDFDNNIESVMLPYLSENSINLSEAIQCFIFYGETVDLDLDYDVSLEEPYEHTYFRELAFGEVLKDEKKSTRSPK